MHPWVSIDRIGAKRWSLKDIGLVEFTDIVGLLIAITFVLMLVVERIRPARSFATVRGWTFVGICFFVLIVVVNSLAALAIPIDWVRQHALVDGTRLGLIGGTLAG